MIHIKLMCILLSTVTFQVLLYNGWRFVGSPAIGYLERMSHTTGKTPGSFRGSTFGLRSNLILKVTVYIHVPILFKLHKTVE